MSRASLELHVRDLTAADLPHCGWAGTGVPEGLERARRGEVDCLVVCAPSGQPVATGGIDHLETPGAGTLYQLHVHELLRSCGIATLLVEEAEQRIRARGHTTALLGVDARDPRPRPLYERLGYREFAHRPGGWDQLDADGTTSRYETTIIEMRKDISALPGRSPSTA